MVFLPPALAGCGWDWGGIPTAGWVGWDMNMIWGNTGHRRHFHAEAQVARGPEPHPMNLASVSLWERVFVAFHKDELSQDHAKRERSYTYAYTS